MSGIVVLGRELARWQTRRVREARGLWGASVALIVVGALLAAGWTTAVWVRTGLSSDLRGILDLEFRGLDLAQGVAALIVSGLALALFVIVRRGRGDTRVVAVVLLLSGVALVALPAWVALRAEDRAVEEVAQVVALSAGISVEEATERVRTEPDLAVRTNTTGVWPSIAAGVLVTIGGVTTLSWIGRRPADPDEGGP
jgi:tryptophan-associated transmembrane protein